MKRKRVDSFWYNLRFSYYQQETGNITYYRRITRRWFKPFEYILDKLQQFMIWGEWIYPYQYGRADFTRTYWFLKKLKGQ